VAVDIVRTFPDTSFLTGDGAPTHAVEDAIEHGEVLHFPHMAFVLEPGEARFLDTRWSDGKAKNISLRGTGDPDADALRGAAGAPGDQGALRALVARYRDHATALVDRLFPHYRGHLRRGNTSLRPFGIEGRATSWRKDDARLHVDAFPSNPMRGVRLLRVFNNLNPHGKPRVWRVGEAFDVFAPKFLPQIPPPLPGSAWLLRTLRITKSRRSEYDHLMLGLHDRGKADLDYQRNAPQQRIDFMPGATWVVFSDQVLHAAMSGQFMMEQTFYLDAGGEKHPETAPRAVLERLVGRTLV
jgi:hypothetical protein